MRRAGRMVCLSLLALGLAGCGDSIAPASDDASAKSAAVAPVGKTARDVARQATGAVPQIVNPAEELVAFDPSGILRWSAVAGADAYEVWAYNDAGLTNLAEFSKALVSRQYQFTQLSGGKTYWIKLYFRANGVWQEAPTFTLQTTVNVTKSRLTNSQEELEAFGPSGTLRWTAVAGADVYELWVYRDAARVAFAETSGPVRITQYQITSLTPGTTYYVQVYARVNGQYTNGGALQLTVTDKLDRARILNPQEELDAFATNGLLRWSPVTGATAYELWIFTNPNSSEIHESSGSLTARSYQTRTLQPGKVYYAQAYALVNGQWQVGSPVKITTITTSTTARLTTPQEQLETFSTNGTLRWTEVPGATAYELWIYSNAGLGKIVESGANPDRSYTTRRLCSGAVYYVQVHALVNGVWTVGWATRLDVTQGTSAGDCIPPSPTVKLTPSALQVERGQNVTLNWTTQFATACTASDGWSGSKGTSGQETVGPLDKNTLFTLTCTGPSGQYLAQTIVTVVPPPMFRLGPPSVKLLGGDPQVQPLGLKGTDVMEDLDGDGRDDLIIGGATYTNEPYPPIPRPGYVAFNTPTGYLADAAKFPFPSFLSVYPRDYAVVDLNKDGIKDLFVADNGWDADPWPGFRNQLFLSQGGQAKWIDATAALPGVEDFTFSVTTGDVNGDGNIDILVGNWDINDPPYLLMGNGSGGFAKDTTRLPAFLRTVQLSASRLVDLDGDGLPELVLGTGFLNRDTQVLWNDFGGFTTKAPTKLAEPVQFGTAWFTYEIEDTDLNGDGRRDLILAYSDNFGGGWQLQFLVNEGNRTFSDQTAKYLPYPNVVTAVGGSTGAAIILMRQQDLNDDGLTDFLLRCGINTTGPADDNCPFALVRQQDSTFKPITIGMLRAAGVGDRMSRGAFYAANGPGASGELVFPFHNPATGEKSLDVQPITFTK